MRGYLLDENLPERLALPTTWPVVHARAIGAGLTDSELWAIAKRESWVSVSKDGDFAERIILSTPPPWIVHLRIGNLRLVEYRAFVAHVWPQVEALLPLHKLITVQIDRIEAVSDP